MIEAIIYYSPQIAAYICYSIAFYLLVYAALKVAKGVRYAIVSDIR